MTIDRSSACVCVLAGDECVCLFGLRWNPVGVRSHHIKPIMNKQPSGTNGRGEELESSRGTSQDIHPFPA